MVDINQNSIKQIYGSSFYDRQREGSLRSAQAILPIVFALTNPKSVVDFGCGVGTWLATAKRLGAEHCLGLEGAWVKTQTLAAADLEIRETGLEQPVSLQERYDLAISLEVAEHLAPERADSFVADLCRASNVVLFSAAIPGQDGDGHQNEQWPSYWAERFLRLGYMPLDVIRPIVQSDPTIEVWYRTNIVLYARPEEGLSILTNLKTKHLAHLDLPCRTEIVGLKRAISHFWDSTKILLHWITLHSKGRLRLNT
ncbi:MAG TPA: methyltransferase domain-containing protein [Methylocella sp.]|jgi:SAM-dependent methyltransferase